MAIIESPFEAAKVVNTLWDKVIVPCAGEMHPATEDRIKQEMFNIIIGRACKNCGEVAGTNPDCEECMNEK
jgi:hypothetical protein